MNGLNRCSCGGEAKLIHERWSEDGAGGWFVRCTRCLKLQTAALIKEEAVEGWNRRYNNTMGQR